MERLPTQPKDASAGLLLRPHGSASPAIAPRVRWRQMLRWAEWVLGVATVLFWGGWLLDGWGRDLVHAWRTPQPATLPIASSVAVDESGLGRSLPVSVAPEPPFVPQPTMAAERVQTLPLAPVLDPRPTHLLIPTIGLDARITEVFLRDGTWQVADYAVGYHHGTGVPGAGNLVLAGHRGMRGSVFAKLESLQIDDDVWIDAASTRFHYRVSATGKVWPDQVGIMQPSAEPILTLITCTNWDTERFVAVATLVGAEPTNASQSVTLSAYGHRER